MKMDKKLKLRRPSTPHRGSAHGPRWGLCLPDPVYARNARMTHDPILGKSWIRHCMWGLGVKSQKLNT